MKKTVVLLFALIIMIYPLSSFANSINKEEKNFNGAVFMKNSNDELVVEATVSDVNIEKSKTGLLGSFKVGKNKIEFLSKITREKDGINYYKGALNVKNVNYECDVVENDNGLSILYYDISREFVRTIIISSISSDLELIKNKINTEVVPKIRNNKLKSEIIEESTTENMLLRSYPINHTHHISKDSIYIPFIISGGSVDGFFHYQTNIDPSAEFYAVDLYGVINWESGFDRISITNAEEMSGVFWGTPSEPTRTIQTFPIGMMAEKQSPYKIKATVSYTLLVKLIPVLYFESDEEYLSY